jgi:hypothetical protein
MVIDQLQEITTDQLLLLITVTQERLDATQKELAMMQQELVDRESNEKWEELLKRPCTRNPYVGNRTES